MNLTLKGRLLLMEGLKNALDEGLISYGTYLSLSEELIGKQVF